MTIRIIRDGIWFITRKPAFTFTHSTSDNNWPSQKVFWWDKILLEKGAGSDASGPALTPKKLYGELLSQRVHLFAEVSKRRLQSLFQAHLRLPLQNSLRLGDIRATLLGIVLRQRLENDRHLRSGHFHNTLRKFQYCNFLWVADICRQMFV